VPEQKPLFTAFFADDVGRVWVLRPTGSQQVDDCDEEFPTIREIRQPTRCWVDELAVDVLSLEDGFLGTISLPEEVVVSPSPVMSISGNELWAVTRRADGNTMLTGYQVPPFR
jgi:hypothetical protein